VRLEFEMGRALATSSSPRECFQSFMICALYASRFDAANIWF
jgi:hypothetical protein